MLALPQVFPADAAATLIPLLRGQIPADRTAAVTAAWNLCGFGCAQIVPAPPIASPSPMSALAAAAHLESALATHKRDMFSPIGPLPWQQIVAAIMPLILQWLAGA